MLHKSFVLCIERSDCRPLALYWHTHIDFKPTSTPSCTCNCLFPCYTANGRTIPASNFNENSHATCSCPARCTLKSHRLWAQIIPANAAHLPCQTWERTSPASTWATRNVKAAVSGLYQYKLACLTLPLPLPVSGGGRIWLLRGKDEETLSTGRALLPAGAGAQGAR